MGGSICIAVREADGTEHVGGYWTNGMPITLSNPKFYEDPETLKKFIERGKKCDKINRSEYGVMLIDFLNRKITSCNGYTSAGSLLIVVSPGCYSDGDYASLVTWMQEKNWITAINDGWDEKPLHPIDREKLFTMCAARAQEEKAEPHQQRSFPERLGLPGSSSMVTVKYNPPGWTIENFMDTDKGFRTVRRRMKSGKWKTPWGRERISIYGD